MTRNKRATIRNMMVTTREMTMKQEMMREAATTDMEPKESTTNYNKKTEDYEEEKKEMSKEQKIRPAEKMTIKKRGRQISIKSVIKSVMFCVILMCSACFNLH
jgi:hypothetical protein